MRSASLTPGLLLVAVAAFCAAIAFGVIAAGTVGMPWFGLKLQALPETGTILIVERDDALFYPGARPEPGQELLAISVPGGNPVALEATDLLPEPDSLDSYAALNAFFARQTQLARLLAHPGEQVLLHLRDPATGTLS